MENVYKTGDVYLGALLFAMGKFVRKEEREGRPNQYLFVFKDKAECEKVATEYNNATVEFNIRKYVNGFRGLKDILYTRV